MTTCLSAYDVRRWLAAMMLREMVLVVLVVLVAVEIKVAHCVCKHFGHTQCRDTFIRFTLSIKVFTEMRCNCWLLLPFDVAAIDSLITRINMNLMDFAMFRLAFIARC